MPAKDDIVWFEIQDKSSPENTKTKTVLGKMDDKQYYPLADLKDQSKWDYQATSGNISIYPEAFQEEPGSTLAGTAFHELVHLACFDGKNYGEKLAEGCTPLIISNESGGNTEDCNDPNCEKEKKEPDENGKNRERRAERPGGDSPDDNMSVASSIASGISGLFPTASNLLIFSNGYFTECEDLVGRFSALVNFFEFPESSSSLLDASKVLVIPSGGFYGIENSEMFKAVLEEYVREGGTLICFAQQHGYEYGVLPRPDGKTVGAFGWREDQSCLTKSIYLDTWHSGLSSVTTPDVSVPVDGYIYDYPEDATVLLRRTANAEPALVTWQVGAGRVIASSLFTDYQGGISDQSIVRDLITWAKNPNLPIPEYNLRNNASPEVSLNLELKNISDTAAAKAKILWLVPDRNVMFEEERLVSIPAGETLSLSISHTFSGITNDKLGIWHVDYELYDAQGEVIQPQAETDSGRFIVSRPPTELFEVSDLTASVTTTGEEFLMGSKVTFQVHFANRAEQDKKLHLWWDLLHREGHYWKEVVVPAQGTLIEEISVDIRDCEGNVRFWLHIFEENGQGVYHSLIDMFRHVTNEAWPYVGSASRGIKVFRPSLGISIQLDKPYYKRGEELKFSLPIKNDVPFDYPVDYTFFIRGRDVNGQEKTSFSDQGTVEMPANGEKTLEKTLFLGEDAGFGQYKASLQINYENSFIRTIEYIFYVSNSYVKIQPQIPYLFVYGQESNLSFNLTCGTIFPAENGNLSLRLVSAQKEELFRETKPVSLAVGETKTVAFSVPMTGLKFGINRLEYAYSDETGVTFSGSKPICCHYSLSSAVWTAQQTIN